MIRKSFAMTLHPGQSALYEERHNPIWPELEQVLKDHGVYQYSIFLHPDQRSLFAYAEIETEEQWEAIAS
ncbi:MAG: L-rhamnose mutarotase, partial [Verrucomicrobiota bacterium]|nr:L-rhamnose mutarotase [Verrucomicrobiota bacterium]